MQQNISLVYDLLFLIVFAVVAVCSWHKGFLASLAELIGAVFGVGIAVWASQTAAPQIYEKFLSASVANRVELALRESNGNHCRGFAGHQLFAGIHAAKPAEPAERCGQRRACQDRRGFGAVDPCPLCRCCCLWCSAYWCGGCSVCWWARCAGSTACRCWAASTRLLGLVLGLANGAVDCWLLALALWFLVGVTGGKLSWLNGYILSQSVGYGIFGSINPFV